MASDTDNLFYNRAMWAQALLFLVLWPAINISLIAGALNAFGAFHSGVLLIVALRVWSIFALAFLAVRAVSFCVSQFHWSIGFRTQLGLQAILIVVCALAFSPMTNVQEFIPMPRVRFVTFSILILEIIIYAFVMAILKIQEREFRNQLNLQQAELNSLRMQSNPHFLFNTLNLIASEIDDSNVKAKALIYDLSDLLRQNVKLAKTDWIDLGEELHLAALFLVLQKKRFSDRLTFDIDYDNDVEHCRVPSLFLLPVVENAIKHGVATYARKAHISIHAEDIGGKLKLQIQDTGDPFDEDKIAHGNGWRILLRTLKLHFENDFEAQLASSEDGACITIVIPIVDRTAEIKSAKKL